MAANNAADRATATVRTCMANLLRSVECLTNLAADTTVTLPTTVEQPLRLPCPASAGHPWYNQPMRRILAALACVALACVAYSRPKVRAITAFINIDSSTYASVVEGTVKFLNTAREAYRTAGFEVETIRVVTQPFPKYTSGMNRPEELALVRKYSELGARLGFTPNIGTAMVGDNDDAAPVDLLADILSGGIKVNASLIVAGDDGIHWRAIRLAAKMVKAVSARSPHGGGNLNFAVTAMVKPYGPFYPGATTWARDTRSPSALKPRMWWPMSSRNTRNRMRRRSNFRLRSLAICAPRRPSPRRLRTRAAGPTRASILHRRRLAMCPSAAPSKPSRARRLERAGP